VLKQDLDQGLQKQQDSDHDSQRHFIKHHLCGHEVAALGVGVEQRGHEADVCGHAEAEDQHVDLDRGFRVAALGGGLGP
jgi:hypothetical protein